MHGLKVELGERSYPVAIAAGALSSPEIVGEMIADARVLVVTNTTVGPLYLSRLAQALGGAPLQSVTLPDGERFKTLATMNEIVTALLRGGYGRDACLVALGGGVVGDITGFAAACYQRGIRHVQAPTTLLAQVDSSVGGKTAVNHELGKNMLGAFHQPAGVIIDTDTLKSLPRRELAAGIAEVIKYGLIRDPAFLAWVETNLDAVLALDGTALAYAIERSCRNKAEVVAGDERESGARALLNLGHTFGHAIETGLGYDGWLHGEAVAAGMLMAADLSARHGWLEAAQVERVRRLLVRAGLPVQAPPSIGPERLLELMQVDKKVKRGRLRLVLLKGIGEAVLSDAFDPALLRQTIAAFTPA